MHPTTRALLALSPLLLGGCDTAPPASGCPAVTADADLYRGLAVDARVGHWTWAEDGGVDGSHDPVDCATYTIDQPGSDWSATGVTPDVIALAPGTYGVTASWSDGTCDYTSDRVEVQVEVGVADVVMSMCVALEGTWTCDDLHRTWEAEVEPLDGCRVALEGVADTLVLDGHLMSGDGVQGIVDATGRSLDADVGQREVSCTRID